MTAAESNYYYAISSLFDNGKSSHYEFSSVGTGVDGGFQNTTELHVMNFEEILKSSDVNCENMKLTMNISR